VQNEITDKILKLTKANQPFVASINGVWGCGKTYYWINSITEELKKNKIVPVYISLFGKQSIADIETEFSLHVIRYIGNNVLSGKGKALRSGLLKKVRVRLSAVLAFLEPDDLSKIIVCFDDFERLSDKISYRDFIGLLSLLKEQKRCKVILIQNSNAINYLEIKRLEEVNIYLEKAVDYEFMYKPSTEDLFEIVKPDILYMDEHLKVFMSEVSISNLRTIKKIINALNDFSFIKDCDYDPRLVERFAFQLMEIAYIYIEERTFESQFDLSYMGDRALGNLSDEEFEEKEKKHNEWKRSAGGKKTGRFVSGYDEARVFIQQYLKTSIPDIDASKDYFERKSEILELEELYASFDSFRVRHRFDLSYTNIKYVEDLNALIDSNKELLKHNVNTLIFNTETLKKLGSAPDSYHRRAVEILKEWLVDIATDFSERHYDSENLELVKKFDSELDKFYETERNKNITEKKARLENVFASLKRVSRDNSWASADIELLGKLTSTEVIEYARASVGFTENAFRFVYKMKNNISDHSLSTPCGIVLEAFKEISEKGSETEKYKIGEMLDSIKKQF